MIPLDLADIADVVGGELADPADAARVVTAVTIDSRRAGPGALFVPLPGEQHDGHDFIADAVGRGAAGYLQAEDAEPAGEPGAVLVDDPADALLGLAAWLRDTVDPAVVAVTGSQGKTTTKDLIAVAVAAAAEGRPGRRVAAAPGSYNNDLGVPLTLCLLERDTQVVVTELGTRGLGHIARLVPVVRPDIAVVTAVGASHLELLGDVDTVGRAKAELVEGLGADGLAVLNADDARVAAMAEIAPGRVITYGRAEAADWRAVDVRLDELARPSFTALGPDGERAEVRLSAPGEHNVGNALAALAVAAELGVDVAAAAAALPAARLSRWRMELVRTADGVTVLNDSYNANPASTEAALSTLARLAVSGQRWAVLGRMAELGSASAEAHLVVGRKAAQLGLDGLVVVGSEAEGIAEGARQVGAGSLELLSAEGIEAAADLLDRRIGPDDAVLVKASRSVGLDRLAERLIAAHGGAAGGQSGAGSESKGRPETGGQR